MSEILVIQNAKYEGLGVLNDLLKKDRFITKTIFAKTEPIPLSNPSAMIILGAPESANDDLQYLKDEMALIRNYAEKNIPILGICLGSQLIAKAFGAKVYQGPKKEIGFYQDVEFDNQKDSNLFRGITSPATVFHWHGDTFDLPKGATRLAHSKQYENQAFRFKSAIAVQFHLEVDEPTIKLWLEKSSKELARTPHIHPDVIKEQIPQKISAVRDALEIFYQNFKSEFNL